MAPETAQDRVDILLKKGVKMPLPSSVFIDEDVDPDRISGDSVTLHPGSRVSGSSTLILPGADIGAEAPAVIKDCQIGPKASLKGGCFEGAVFLKGASMGSASHVRPGTILEEQASGAHSVGLKQTILFPFATLGSLINFCDCFLAGGTDRKNHSEVGSSYIHFNYTPQQDKATASMMGDVSRGVMLREAPIFLGGQGGMVGPCLIDYGTVIAAGIVWRKDVKKPGLLVFEHVAGKSRTPFTKGIYRGVKRTVRNNLAYIANLIALRLWYVHARSLFVQGDQEAALHKGLVEKCDAAIDERVKRLGALAENMPESIRLLKESSGDKAPSTLLDQKSRLFECRDKLSSIFEEKRLAAEKTNNGDGFLEILLKAKNEHGPDYIDVIKSLSSDHAMLGSQWLEGFSQSIITDSLAALSVF